MIKYRIDVLEELKKRGYSTYRLRKDKLIGESTIQGIREGKMSDLITIDRVCELLDMELCDVIERVPNE